MPKQTPMAQFVVAGEEIDDLLIAGSYEIDEIGDLKDEAPGQPRRGLRSNAEDDDHGGTGEYVLYDSKGEKVLEFDLNCDRPTTPEFRAALLTAFRDYLDQVDPIEARA